ncbi:hypothetical protein C4J81_10740 [Deltaproteobacteria bacterium Smac51]|nr:hypothetical protein C4J81_10740 [Deltaproteobacteria bacterium Smac51]
MSHYIDLHIHSRYSRATSSALNPANLSLWAGYKGLGLIGTGDLTHPVWLKELRESLTLRDDGLYSLNDQPDGPRFVPTGEVSAIYKQDGRTRKIHLVIIAPDLDAAEKFSKTLGALGNVESDGRPILGLSARHILEIALTTHPEMMVVPAHIWTPWFSLFGAKSGFDHLEECFGDLSPHITALETGLSSDPAMNRLVSALDKYPLISSSDAHSPDKLGREATILKDELTWANLSAALKGGPSLGGTVEFFPEEGKYHLDGHLSCGPAMTPAETRANGGLCPVCGKPVTIGVLHRVSELADRETPLEDRLPDYHLIPLAELLGQVWGVGPKSRKVVDSFNRLIGEFGNEMTLLLETPLEDIESVAGPLLRLAIDRMRRAEDIEASGGFDGQFGTVRAITAEDRATYGGQGLLFEVSKPAKPKRATVILPTLNMDKETEKPEIQPAEPCEGLSLVRGDLLLDCLDADQSKAVTSQSHALAVVAGPGSGKTRVLVHRAAWMIRENLVRPEEMLLTTYTRKAALELGPRLLAALPFRSESRGVKVATLHALGYEFLKRQKPDWELASGDFLAEVIKKSAKKAGMKPSPFASLLTMVKNSPALRPGETDLPENAPEAFNAAFRYYNKTLAAYKRWDFDDLILEAAPDGPTPYKAVLVDEFQDLSATQFSFIKRLLPPVSVENNTFLTVIGDPEQSIYSFRGARAEIFDWLKIYPGLESVDLPLNYRATKIIAQAGEDVINTKSRTRRAARSENGPKLTRASLASPKREAAYVASRIMAHLGVLKLGREATSRQDADFMSGLGLNDVAVLFRLRSQGEAMAAALDEAGLPWQMSGEEPLTAADHLDFTADKINLLTMHASKGLEFRLVFIIGAEEGLSPYILPSEEPTEARLAEEKRLFYVAVTRAKERLYITRAAKRRLYGQPLSGEPSPYWNDLASALCLDVVPQVKTARPKPLPTLFD